MLIDNNEVPMAKIVFEINGHYNTFSLTGNYGNSPPNGQWHNWVFTTSINGSQFFLDGQIILDTNFYVNNTSIDGTDLIIGAMINTNGVGIINDSNNEPWNGKIDDIGIWNRSTYLSKIQEL